MPGRVAQLFDRYYRIPDHLIERLRTRTTLRDTTWPTARIFPEISELHALKGIPGKAFYVVGGPGLVASLINSCLLDELRLIVHPVAVGHGTPLLGGMAQRQALELVRTEPRASGRVNLTYRVRAAGAVTAAAA